MFVLKVCRIWAGYGEMVDRIGSVSGRQIDLRSVKEAQSERPYHGKEEQTLLGGRSEEVVVVVGLLARHPTVVRARDRGLEVHSGPARVLEWNVERPTEWYMS